MMDFGSGALLGVPLASTVGLIGRRAGLHTVLRPYASGLLDVLLAFARAPTHALYGAGQSVAIQRIEGNQLMSWVERWAVELPPVLGIT